MSTFERTEKGQVVIRDARIIYRNFTGEKRPFNNEGERNFCVIIDDNDVAKQMSDEGWNVKIKAPRNDEGEPFYFVQVKVNYKAPPRLRPEIYAVTRHNRRLLDEGNVAELDSANIEKIDLLINPRVKEDGGLKAYCQEMYVTIREGFFANEYDS